jgi:hypothetical protein
MAETGSYTAVIGSMIIVLALILVVVFINRNTSEKIAHRAARGVEKERAAMEAARRTQERRAPRVENNRAR